jgi:3-hydroxy-9,10-secoandrosta-1,3,5(10)-triene-9,17-dione monooxygenase reductase component
MDPMDGDSTGRSPGGLDAVGAIDPAHYRTVLGHFASGVTIVTGAGVDGPVGFTCQSFFALSLDPALVAIAPGRSSTSWPMIAPSGAFCVNVLSEDQEELCRSFATTGGAKFAGVGWSTAATGSPVVAGSLAWVDCRIEVIHDAGDHLLVVGRVVEMSGAAGRPLLFYRGGFGSFEV